MSSRTRKRTLRELLRDLVFYLLIGGAIAVLALGYAVYLPDKYRPEDRWIGLIANTPVTLGYPLSWFRHHWRVWRFWSVWALLLLVHLLAFVVLLKHVEHFGLLWYVVLNQLEWAAMYPVLDWAGHPLTKKRPAVGH